MKTLKLHGNVTSCTAVVRCNWSGGYKSVFTGLCEQSKLTCDAKTHALSTRDFHSKLSFKNMRISSEKLFDEIILENVKK